MGDERRSIAAVGRAVRRPDAATAWQPVPPTTGLSEWQGGRDRHAVPMGSPRWRDVGRRARFQIFLGNPPLLIAKPKQVPGYDPNALPPR